MKASKLDFRIAHRVRKIVSNRRGIPGFKDFAASPQVAAQSAAAASSDLERLFFAHDGRLITKWPHYLPVYERFLAPYRGGQARMLEIGVFRGGSLQLWRKYLGAGVKLYGIDIDPTCAALADPPTQVRIGSQDDASFLRGVVSEMGGVDIVLDDGSHVGEHQLASFDALFPLLSDGGLYIIEDMHTAYWPVYKGGLGKRGTAVEFVKTMIDDMHGWYHSNRTRTPAKDQIGAIHVYDSITVIEKRRRQRPFHISVEGKS